MTPDVALNPSNGLEQPGGFHGACDELPPSWASLLEPLHGSASRIEVRHITTGGSDRAFYRVSSELGSHVLCVTPNRTEFTNYIAIGQFLRGHGLPLPQIHGWCDDTGLAVLQDAGDVALQQIVLSFGAEDDATIGAYSRVLETLGQLQRVSAQDCPAMRERPFSRTDLRWETEYFRENFLGRHLGWDLSGDDVLTAEFERLADRVLEEPLYPMHRDFQSQNVFLQGDVVWILDFQGARLGPLCYDVASLLRDPYVCLPAHVEDHLLRYYHAAAMPPVARYADFDDFRRVYNLVSMQRLMQALGAYGFLTLVKGKPWFSQWFAPAVVLLSRAVRAVDGFPRLRQVVLEAAERQSRL